MKLLSPKESGNFVASFSKNVSLSKIGISKLANEILVQLRAKKICVNNFSQNELHPQKCDEAAINWIFLVDALNFSFWTPPNSPKKWNISFNGKVHTGYFGLCAAINRAMQEGIDITNPEFYSKVDRKTLEHIFRPDSGGEMIPLLDERVNVLHQVGSVLLDKYKGSFATCVRQCSNSAQSLLKLIVSDFPCFNDVAVYKDNTVSLHKRAQIVIADIWTCFRGNDLGMFTDIDTITMFADYRVPQVLVHYRAMVYSDELMSKLKANCQLENGSEDEVEIRACSIKAVELVKDAVMDLMTEEDKDLVINSILIDHFLWDYRRQHAEELEVIPFHQTRCVYY